MKLRIFCVSFFCVTLLTVTALAAHRYQSGKIVKVEQQESHRSSGETSAFIGASVPCLTERLYSIAHLSPGLTEGRLIARRSLILFLQNGSAVQRLNWPGIRGIELHEPAQLLGRDLHWGFYYVPGHSFGARWCG